MVMVLAPDKRARQAAAAKGDTPPAAEADGGRPEGDRSATHGPAPVRAARDPPPAATTEAAPAPAPASHQRLREPAAAPQSAASPTGPPPGEG